MRLDRARLWATATEALWRLIFPEQCVVCGRVLEPPRRHLCAPCHEALPWVGEHYCPRCGHALGLHAATAEGCAGCRGRHFAFRRAVAPLRYEGVARDLILQFKLGRKASLAYLLGDLLCDYLAQGGLSQAVDLVVPVPLHWRRRVARGFNQAGLLAIEVATRFGLPIAQRLLRRYRPTPSQTALSGLGRGANVRGAFTVRRSCNGATLLGRLANRLTGAVDLLARRVLLVDDVLTTGSTVNECARVLLDAGAAEVLVATVARTHHSVA